MSNELTLNNVSVHFLLPQIKSAGLLGAMRTVALGGLIQRAHQRVGLMALDNINLSLRDGDRLGIIGHNGAGKTTLLRVMASILPPSSGSIKIAGRISALMSISLGLDTHASGYDNIKYRARYMGCSEEEISEQFQDIVDFCELGDYLALPMKSYSAGMRLRLAFAVATAFQPDVMILDEWLSAGDQSFQTKAAKRLDKLIDKTGIVALASHNSNLLKRVCNKGLVLDRGRLVFIGPIDEAAERDAELRRKRAEKPTPHPLEAAE